MSYLPAVELLLALVRTHDADPAAVPLADLRRLRTELTDEDPARYGPAMAEARRLLDPPAASFS